MEKDAWERWSDEIYDPELACELSATLRIQYVDANSQVTFRTIDVEKFCVTEEGGIVVAFCRMRQSRRPFRISRIQFVADVLRAEVIHDLAAWLRFQYDQTPLGQRDAFIHEHQAALGAIFYVAKADGAFRTKEKAAMAAMCAELGLANTQVQTLVTAAISSWGTPSAIAYGKDLKSLATRSTAYRQIVCKAATAIATSDRTVMDSEVRAVARMEKALKSS